jgi:hypothetical protein
MGVGWDSSKQNTQKKIGAVDPKWDQARANWIRGAFTSAHALGFSMVTYFDPDQGDAKQRFWHTEPGTKAHAALQEEIARFGK